MNTSVANTRSAKTRVVVVSLALCCIAVLTLLTGALADAASPFDSPVEAQKKVAARAADPEPPPHPIVRGEAPELAERVGALERQNLVLREDLGKARLDTRTRLEAAEQRHNDQVAQLQKRIDELNAQLASERDRQSRKSRNLWLAVGVLAIGIIATN